MRLFDHYTAALEKLAEFTFQEWLYEKPDAGFSKVSTYITKAQAGRWTAEFNTDLGCMAIFNKNMLC